MDCVGLHFWSIITLLPHAKSPALPPGFVGFKALMGIKFLTEDHSESPRIQALSLAYAFLRRSLRPAKPSRPKPPKTNVLGSGTAAMLRFAAPPPIEGNDLPKFVSTVE